MVKRATGSAGRVLAAAAALFLGGFATGSEVNMAAANKSNSDAWEWNVREDRPRIYLDEARLEFLRGKVKGRSVEEVKALAGTSAEGMALAYVLTGDEECGRAAIDEAIRIADGGGYYRATQLAIVYDWCRALFTDDEARRARKWMASVIETETAKTAIWRSFHNFCYSHGLAVGMCSIAISHEDPAAETGLAFLNRKYRDIMKVFEILLPDGEWAEGFDYNRVATYPAFRFLWALKTSCGVDLMADSVHMRNNPLYCLYGTKANGLVYVGEDNDHGALGYLDREMLLMAAAEWRDPYAQYFLNHCRAGLFVPDESTCWRDLLWYDETIAERNIDELPLSRIFRGKELVMARSGWGWDEGDKRRQDTWVTFKCGKYFAGHCHYDNGHFDIYYKGELAHDSGRYDDDWGMQKDPAEILKSEFFNYYRRSIAHNTILVYDPDEQFEMGGVNDGGQKDLLMIDGEMQVPADYDAGVYPTKRGPGADDWVNNNGRWDTGEMLAYEATSLYTYACGDATNSYSEAKMKRFVRQLLFVQPDVVVVFDRVVSTKAEFKKTWLLHTVTEPTLFDGGFEVTNGDGRLACVTVLPAQASAEKIGGPGDEFLVAGVHYAVGPNASSGRFAELSPGEIPGAWRVEVSPAKPAEEDYFLNVMLVTDKEVKTVPAVSVLADDREKVTISVVGGKGGEARITFAKGDTPAASLTLVKDGKTQIEKTMPTEIVLEKGRLR